MAFKNNSNLSVSCSKAADVLGGVLFRQLPPAKISWQSGDTAFGTERMGQSGPPLRGCAHTLGAARPVFQVHTWKGEVKELMQKAACRGSSGECRDLLSGMRPTGLTRSWARPETC